MPRGRFTAAWRRVSSARRSCLGTACSRSAATRRHGRKRCCASRVASTVSRTATVSRSVSTNEREPVPPLRGSTRRPGGSSMKITYAVLAAALTLASAAPARGGPRLADVRGHLAFGYGKLFADEAPGGSLSIAGGVAIPVASSLQAGIELGFDLLGTRTEEEGSLNAELDYSVVEALALLHWTPPFPGPVGLISVGPGFFSARADLSSSGGAAFSDLAVEEAVLGVAIGATLMSRRPAPVRLGRG